MFKIEFSVPENLWESALAQFAGDEGALVEKLRDQVNTFIVQRAQERLNAQIAGVQAQDNPDPAVLGSLVLSAKTKLAGRVSAGTVKVQE